jgi:predicted esterase
MISTAALTLAAVSFSSAAASPKSAAPSAPAAAAPAPNPSKRTTAAPAATSTSSKPDTSRAALRAALPYRHHALEEKQMGLYAVYLPKNYRADSAKGKKYPLCVILHGSGSTEIGHGSMAEAYRTEDIIFLAPRAPYPEYDVILETKEEGFTAWPRFPSEWGDWDDPGFPKDEMKKIDAVQLYADWIADCVRDVRARYPISADKAIVVGHSQGAAFAHIFAVRHPEMVKAYAAYAGHFGGPGLADDRAAKILSAGKVFPVILHCENDSVVPVSESRDLMVYLKTNEVPFESKLFPGGNHWITTRPNAAIREFIFKWGLGKPVSPLRGELRITKVLKGSRADSLGLAVGDRLSEFGGRKIRNLDEYLAAIDSAEAKPEIGFVIRRAEKILKFTMPQGKLGVYTGER